MRNWSFRDRESVILRALETNAEGSLEDLFILYSEEIGILLKRLGKDMTAVQERIVELANKFGVRERISKEEYEKGREEGREKGREKGERRKAIKIAIQLRNLGMDINSIAKAIELPEKWLERFFKKINRI